MRITQRVKKRIIRGGIIALSVFAVLLISAVLILYTQQRRITEMAVAELNKQFKGELSVENSNISLFKNFPYVSIALHGVRFYPDKTHTGQSLYQVDRLYVGFSLPKLLRGQYHVRRLFLKGGYVALVRNKNGTLNLAEAKNLQSDTSQQSSESSSGLEIDLQKMVIRDMQFSLLDKTTGQQIQSNVSKLTASFKSDSLQLAVGLDTDMELDVSSPADTTFFRHKHLVLDIHADYTKSTQHLRITTGAIQLQDAGFRLEGEATLGTRSEVDFRVKGDKPDLNLLAAFIPGDVATMLKPFRYDGHIFFDGKIKGTVSQQQLPLIEVSFGCENAWFHNTGADKKLDSLGFKGFYTNGAAHNLQTSELHMTNVMARPGKGIFKGNFVVRDFTDPKVLMQLHSELDLAFVGAFLGIPDLEHITGKVKLDMNFKELMDFDLPEQYVSKLKDGIQSELTVDDLSFRIPGYPHPIRDMDLHAAMKNGMVTLDSLRVRAGGSDIRLSGSVSDVAALLHAPDKPVTIRLQANSRLVRLKDIFAGDTALANKLTEEIHGFRIGVSLATTVRQLLQPKPLPEGTLTLEHLQASFKKYPHAFRDIGATLRINDTALLLKDFTGRIDASDFRFSGRVINYALWFQPFKKGKTQVAFDFKSERLAMEDLLGPVSRKHVPVGYQDETASNVWLRARADLRYDTAFRFAKIRIANISGSLKKHAMQLDSISGNILYGANRILKVDTLKGRIGRSDFDISLRLFNGKDSLIKNRTNYLYFRSRFLDVDQLSGYRFSPVATTAPAAKGKGRTTPDSLTHAKAFNIFTLPFPAFEVKADIGRFKYNKLWLQGVTARLRMQEDHYIHLDTLGMKVAGGYVGMRGYLNGSNPEKIYFRSRIRVNDVDMEKMLIKLDHFGQDLVINKNIKGRLTGNIRSHVQIHPDFVPILHDTKAELDVEIRNGSLVDFTPMKAMAGYFKDKNLQLVRFDTLRNKLTFTNGTLNIPAMNINSSLGFMEISGRQSLDMKMEYYMRVPMKMVTQVGFQALFGKKQAEVDIDQVDAIEYRDKDKKQRFMSIKVTGTPDNFKVGLGKAKRS
ncbi:AsmA-like C-terminal region-containing protein [Chitinophaga deserti]|uniref:AsmA-like C-terminal region-containing protein n=1 Tax=Chitinophaga deserti TaxID=2164099 RepID=UPI001E5E4D11|nr:AsmA-like C-terminal region-containing protein [Chitinophaga deserti]